MGKHRNSEHHIDGYSLFALFIMLLFFFFILYCTSHTSLIADDYAYMFDFSTGWDEPNTAGIYPPPEGCERINSVTQIIPSMSAHRSCMNGRVFSHGLVQLFLMLPKSVFNVIDALIFTLEMGLIAFVPSIINRGSKTIIPWFLLYSFSCICIFQFSFGEVNLWLDGAVNYLWGSVLGLSYIGSYLTLFRDRYDFGGKGRTFGMLILSFVVGAYNESLSCAVISFSFLVIVYLLSVEHRKLSIGVYLSLLFTIVGFVFLVSAPATLANKIHDGSLRTALGNVLNTIPGLVRTSRRLMIMFAAIILLIVYAVVKKVNRVYIAASVILLISSIICFFSLSLASVIPSRALFFVPVLLCMNSTWLMTGIFEKTSNHTLQKAASIMILVSFFLIIVSSVTEGISDIYQVYIQTDQNEKRILDAKESGESIVFIYDIPREGLSSFVALEGLNYIDRDNPESWPNVYMAKYYGLDEIRAVR